MSILSQQTATFLSSGVALFILAALLVSVPLGLRLGVHHAGNAVGPARLSPLQPAYPLAIALGMGFCAMVMTAGVYFSARHLGAAGSGSAGPAPGVVDQAFLFSVPPIVGVAVLCSADYLLGGIDLLRRLGMRTRLLPSGMLAGIAGALVVIPPTYVVSILTEAVYQKVHYEHPPEHELLTLLAQGPAHPLAHWILIASATLVAPFCEEWLFRAHLQTLMQRVLVLVSSPRPVLKPAGQTLFAFPVIRPATALGSPLGIDPASQTPLAILPAVAPPGDAPITAMPATTTLRPLWQTWTAILLTSFIFALFHPLWMRPPIFALSVGLGYCYERTGNLWTNITVHCLFNSASTVFFLASAHS